MKIQSLVSDLIKVSNSGNCDDTAQFNVYILPTDIATKHRCCERTEFNQGDPK